MMAPSLCPKQNEKDQKKKTTKKKPASVSLIVHLFLVLKTSPLTLLISGLPIKSLQHLWRNSANPIRSICSLKLLIYSFCSSSNLFPFYSIYHILLIFSIYLNLFFFIHFFALCSFHLFHFDLFCSILFQFI